MRADFWDRPLRHGSFARLIEGSTINVTALAPDELERAIIEPAHRLGAEFEPGLVSEIVADLTDQPGGLPLLQYALTELWEQQVSGLLTRDAYHRLGGVAGALTRRAEALYLEATPDEQEAIRPLFGRLVIPGEGTEDTRRRAPRSELGRGDAVDHVIDRYGAARLLSFDTDPATREPSVEVAHEALIRQWPRLREWLDEDRHDIRIQRHLNAGATEWDKTGRPEAELYRGGRLEAAEEWANGHTGELSQIEAAFLEAGVEQRERAARAELERLRRLRGLLTATAVVAVVALIAGIVAFQQRGEADRQAELAQGNAADAIDAQRSAERERDRADAQTELAETRRMVADATSLVGDNPDLAMLLAAEAYRREETPLTLSGLQRVLSQTGPYLGTIANGETFLRAGWLADGTIVGLRESQVVFFDPATNEVLDTVDLPVPPGLPAIAFGENVVAVGLGDGSVFLIDNGQTEVFSIGADAISAIDFSSDGNSIAIGDTSGAVTLFDRSTNSRLWSTQVILDDSARDVIPADRWAVLESLGFADLFLALDPFIFGTGPRSLIFEPGTLLVGAGVHLRRLDLVSGDVVQELLLEAELAPGLPSVAQGLISVVVGPDGEINVVSNPVLGRVSSDLRDQRWFPATGRGDTNVRPLTLGYDASGTAWLALDNGQLARTAGVGEAAELIVTGLPDATGFAISPDGTEALVPSSRGIVRWSLGGSQLLAQGLPRLGNNEMYVSADGETLIASNLRGQQSVVYDLSGPQPRSITAAEYPMTAEMSPMLDPLGRYVAAWSNGAITLLERDSLDVTGIELPDAGLGESWSSDGRLLAYGGFIGTRGYVYDIDARRQIATLDLAEWMTERDLTLAGMTFDPADERLLVWVPSGSAVIFHTDTWQPDPQPVITPEEGGIQAAAFSPTGDLLVTRNLAGTIEIRDPQTFEVVRVIAGGTNAAEALAFGPYISHDGDYLLTVRDLTPRLWHLPTGTQIGAFPHDPGNTSDGRTSPQQLRLATAVGDQILTWNLDFETWPEIACRAAGRNLTTDEWAQYGDARSNYQVTCSQWPSLG